MQTRLSDRYRDTPAGQKAESILRRCVHCGFCTATCPTYRLLGDELDGPRGRIYLIKQMLEDQPVGQHTLQHLDRCLSCRSCETTCPSGVQYAQLLDIGREIAERRIRRPLSQRLQRYLLRRIVPRRRRLALLLGIARAMRPLLPARLRSKVPCRGPTTRYKPRTHGRHMLLLESCGQASISPQTNIAARQVLDHIGIGLESAPRAGCCGALSLHLAATNEACRMARRNIDAWWPFVEQGIEAIVTTASGCGVMLRDYGELLADDPKYADKARHIASLARDIGEVVAAENPERLALQQVPARIAFHSPCTLQHGLRLGGLVEDILQRTGFELTPVRDTHLCCGSAGVYSLLQPEISHKLLIHKTSALQAGKPDIIATANIGCQTHLATRAQVPVRHWIEIIAERLPGSDGSSSR